MRRPSKPRSDADEVLDLGLPSVTLSEGDREETPSGTLVLPLVPIRDSVYFPHTFFPLFVGRERSVRAVEAAMESGRSILLATQRSLLTDEPSPEEIYDIGIVAEVMHLARNPDNTLRVMLEGATRVRLTEFLQTEPYLLVRTETLPPPAAEDNTTEALARSIVSQFERLVAEGKGIPPEALESATAAENGDQLADTITAYLPLRVEEKQELLATLSVRERLERLAGVLRREFEIASIQRDIHSRVERELGENQREFFLREQLKAIQAELGERDDRVLELDEYRGKLEAAGMPEMVEARAFKELDRFAKTPLGSPESAVLRTYLDWLAALPWSARTEDRLDLAEAERILDEDHYGLARVKERILEFLSVRKLAGDDLKGPILCFVGPPGVGKTSLGRSVARALGRKFVRLSLGGVRDEAEIRGHRRTYVGAMPGRIVQAIRQAGTRNPVLVLDEIDKLGHDLRGDPSAALLEALDPEQNSEFSDHYLEVPLDLSQVLFVATANLLDPIPPALRDRLEVIPFSSYVEEEKLAIAERHLLPKQRQAHGLAEEMLTVDHEAVIRIIREYTREPGVRHLERELAALCRKAARRIVTGDAVAVDVDADDIAALLGAWRYRWGVAEERDEVGAATGLAFTESGGDTMVIEVQLTRSAGAEGQLLLTGQLGDIMKESAQTAWTFVRSRLERLGVPDNAALGREIHVHVPAGAVPKDGPSAGVAIATALASALSGRPVRRDVAMTGEITLRGKVLAVGGVKEKTLAAYRAGIREVLLPAENEKDIDEVPATVRECVAFRFVQTADEVLDQALLSR